MRRSGAVGCTESEALGRLDRVLAAHDRDIKSLGRFARRDRTASCSFPAITMPRCCSPLLRRRALEAFGAPSGRVEVAAAGSWASPDGRIVVEHGHQIGPSVRTAGELAGAVRPASGTSVARDLAASSRCTGLYNRLEERYPIVDNMAAAGIGLKYALAAADGSSRRRRWRRCCAPSCCPHRGSSSGWSSTTARWSRRCGTSRRCGKQGAAFIGGVAARRRSVQAVRRERSASGRWRRSWSSGRRGDRGGLRLPRGRAAGAAAFRAAGDAVRASRAGRRRVSADAGDPGSAVRLFLAVARRDVRPPLKSVGRRRSPRRPRHRRLRPRPHASAGSLADQREHDQRRAAEDSDGRVSLRCAAR